MAYDLPSHAPRDSSLGDGPLGARSSSDTSSGASRHLPLKGKALGMDGIRGRWLCVANTSSDTSSGATRHLPLEGKALGKRQRYGFPLRGSCRRQATDEVGIPLLIIDTS